MKIRKAGVTLAIITACTVVGISTLALKTPPRAAPPVAVERPGGSSGDHGKAAALSLRPVEEILADQLSEAEKTELLLEQFALIQDSSSEVIGDFLRSIPEGAMRDAVVDKMIERGSTTPPEVAMAAIIAAGGDELSRHLSRLAAAWPVTDVKGMKKLWLTYKKTKLPPGVLCTPFAELAKRHIEIDRDSLFDMMIQIGSPNLDAAARFIVPHIYPKSPEDAWELVMLITPRADEYAAAYSYGRAAYSKDHKGWPFIDSLPAGPRRDRAVEGYLENWANDDLNGALSAIDSLPSGKIRDGLIWGNLARIAELDLSSAKAWVDQISTPAGRASAMKRLESLHPIPGAR